MAVHKIQNEELSVEVSTLGAELYSINHQGTEYLWPGNPETWNGRAPILFPIIGPLLNGSYQLDGKSYQMGQHGFARHSEWQLIQSETDFLLFSLKENEQIQKLYPFAFYLEAGYRIVNNKLECSYRVNNQSAIDMPFAIGSHTAFRVPIDPSLNFSDYELEFEKQEDTVRYLQISGGPLSGETVAFRTQNRKLPLEHSFFANSSIVFKELASERITIQSPKDKENRKASISFAGFPYCTLWTYFHRSEPYLCIEPWYGVTPTVGSSTDMREREGNLCLKPKQEFSCQFQIALGSVNCFS